MKKFAFAISFFLLLCVSTLVNASGGGGHEEHGPDMKFLYVGINFAILAGLLFFGLRKPASEFFGSRALNSKKRLEEATKFHDEAKRQFELIQSKLTNAEVEGKELIKSVKAQAEQEKLAILAHATDLSQKIQKDAERMINQEVVKARAELKSEAVELAMTLAEDKLRKELTPEDQVRLGADFISGIKTARVS